ncbi:unnamed protein product [Commensalibacter communis]|uniref:hypothetical protein n=1 Tax=Commensalibacter communis TaxID=2972786 RepID=UPI0022FF7121|nr:hypothetical protein [Commensalibacter communis]CAI3938227.1 unnamed protein product [Commensalibacter communis]CAI3939482.1 unnamed protein product [Commensalibacter communis]
MPSSTSAFNAWRKFAFIFLGITGGAIFFIWLFIVVVDPWGMLPLSPPFHRIPISTNARYSFPALAVNKEFDSAIFGTSTSRPLQPQILNPPFDAHFVNLSMNASTPWEQEKIFNLFLKHHPNPKVIIFNTDNIWCFEDPHHSARPIPLWMYEGSPWVGYFKMANQYALQEAANQFAWLIGFKKQRYGSDGYTPLLPASFVYDPNKVNKTFTEWAQEDNSAPNGRIPIQPALPRLQRMINKLPKETVKVIIIPPFSAEFYGKAGGWTDTSWKSCKANIASVIQTAPNSIAVDFAIPNHFTQRRTSFWDPIHYRPFTAKMVMDGIIKAVLDHQELPNNESKILEQNIQ